jgi:hypothetical protein
VFRCSDARRFASLFMPCFEETQRRWLITCERGLIELGARKAVADGSQEVHLAAPEELGQSRVVGQSILSEGWGRLYLIEMKRPVRLSGEPQLTAKGPAP